MKALLSISAYSIKQCIERSAYKYTILVQPILFATLFYLINRASGYGLSSLAIILRSGMISLWSSVCFSSLCDLQRERDGRTLASLLGTPTSLFNIILGKVIPNTITGLTGFLVSTLTVLLLSREMTVDCTVPEILFCVTILLFSYILTAMFIIPIFSIYDNVRLLINCIEYPIFMITGMAFPITYLPKYAQFLGRILPMTWGIKIVNNTIIDRSGLHREDLLTYALIALFYIVIDIMMFKWVEYKIRNKAQIRI